MSDAAAYADPTPGPPTGPLTGRTALVTGGGTGLGAAITRALHASGASVVITGRRVEPLDALAGELDHVAAQVCDVADSESVNALAAALADREISIVINNAGVAGPVGPLTEIEVDAWDEVFDINVRGVFLVCKAFLPGMVARGHGDVINLASVSGKRPLVRRTPYCASKMAVIGLTSTLAFEVGPSGVNVNSLSPGPVDGPRMDRNFRLEAERSGRTYDEAVDTFVSRAALGRMVTETEVGAAVVAMLAMPGLCGADIDLSAGMVA
ncbi:MAG TPA: SDR family oxidoreductase [Microlunatus sp.]